MATKKTNEEVKKYKKELLIQNCLALQAAIVEKDATLAYFSDKPKQKRAFPSIIELKKLTADQLSQHFMELKKTYDKLDMEQTSILDRISVSARTDGLTGLYNQKYFNELLKNEISRTYWGIKNKKRDKGLALLFIDLDDFKKFNTFYGHLSGNKVLEIVAKCILTTIRISDIASRFGGDEFVIMLPETDKSGAIIVANNLLNNLKTIGIKASIGISEYNPRDVIELPLDVDAEATKLLTKADKALYHVKSTGKSRAVVH